MKNTKPILNISAKALPVLNTNISTFSFNLVRCFYKNKSQQNNSNKTNKGNSNNTNVWGDFFNILIYFFNLTLKDKLIFLVDVVLLIFVISLFLSQLLSIFISFIYYIFEPQINTDLVNWMTDISKTSSEIKHTTNVKILPNGTWSDTIRSIFIYGTGSLRLAHLVKSGGAGSKTFIVTTTILSDAGSQILSNAINDPNYILNHYKSWKEILESKPEDIGYNISQDKALNLSEFIKNINKSSTSSGSSSQEVGSSVSESVSKFIPDMNGIDDLGKILIQNLLKVLKPILEPVSVTYSNELLADQIYFISILLFLLSIFIFIFIVLFMVNTIVFIYSDKIRNFFSNKYIRWYINFNKKFIAIELICLGFSILYFMSFLVYGLHFLAVHPISLNQ
uniref:Uncharacterized protein n=1 Tax=Cyclocybe aegerita TaxID=1973307 RepID=A0A884P6I2_CYCAE|nr:hypothetical protein K4014_mgp39 [Cyclocybe aegerita]QQP21437.1 hypothetical protein [Cyclocybe aegerita]